MFANNADAQVVNDSSYIFEIPKKVEENSDSSIGVVIIRVCVDRNGNVVSSNFEKKGSTTIDEDLINIAKENGYKYKFEKKENAPDPQCGTIRYDFKLKDSITVDTLQLDLNKN